MSFDNWESELYHHGILGMKWGVTNGPPYPLSGGQFSSSERKMMDSPKSSVHKKRYNDRVIKKGTIIQTLSYDKNRTKKTDMFYGTYKKLDNHQYAGFFNAKIKVPIKDKNGNEIGYDTFLKYRIQNKAKKNISVASEDSSADVFKNLFKKDRDFYNFVSDPKRMQSYFVNSKYKFKGYREAREALEKLRARPKEIDALDVAIMYRMFNYVIPYSADKRGSHDVSIQRAKFFREMKNRGYSAILDTNDSIYGGMKATAPIVLFDTKSVAFQGAKRVTIGEKKFSKFVTVGRKVLGI